MRIWCIKVVYYQLIHILWVLWWTLNFCRFLSDMKIRHKSAKTTQMSCLKWQGQFEKSLAMIVLRWFPFKIMSCSPAFHSKWPTFTENRHYFKWPINFIFSQNWLKLNCRSILIRFFLKPLIQLKANNHKYFNTVNNFASTIQMLALSGIYIKQYWYM